MKKLGQANSNTKTCMISCILTCLVFVLISGGLAYSRVNGCSVEAAIPMLTITVFFVLAVLSFWVGKYGQDISEKTIIYVIVWGIAIRLFYVALTQGHYFQNDIGSFEEDNLGHLGYIYYIFSNNSLPDVVPQMSYQFYHPPFYYMISALVSKIYILCGGQIELVDEALQYASVAYSGIVLIYLNKILQHIDISLIGRFIAMALITFLPYSVMMSGALNNDLLMYMLSVMCVYYFLKWYDTLKYPYIIATAVCIGLAMMTKISAALLVPGMTIVMVMKLWQQRKKVKNILLQFGSFGVIALPIGLWFPLYNYFKYDTPLGFVPRMADTFDQFIGQYSKWQRLFDFNGALDSIVLSWSGSNGYIDYNIWVSLLKFAVTGEGYNVYLNIVLSVVAYIVFYMTLFIMFGIIIGMFVFLFGDKRNIHIKILFFTTIWVSMLSYLKFCLSYTHVCTMHIRYVMLAYYMGCILAGGGVETIWNRLQVENKKTAKILMISIHCFIWLYMIMVSLLYLNLEFVL